MPIRLSRAQVREIDRRSIEEFQIPGIVLMENAARAAADIAFDLISHDRNPSAVIYCGGGNNGGDGLAIARHLHNRGVNVVIVPMWTSEPKGDALINLRIAQAMQLRFTDFDSLIDADLTIDALFGTGLTRRIEEPLASFVNRLDGRRANVVAVDVPSGLDCDTGEPLGPCVRASRTVTFVAEKIGFANPKCREFTGEIFVADIGCPRELIESVTKSQT